MDSEQHVSSPMRMEYSLLYHEMLCKHASILYRGAAHRTDPA